jgi:hypothetical protein
MAKNSGSNFIFIITKTPASTAKPKQGKGINP